MVSLNSEQKHGLLQIILSMRTNNFISIEELDESNEELETSFILNFAKQIELTNILDEEEVFNGKDREYFRTFLSGIPTMVKIWTVEYACFFCRKFIVPEKDENDRRLLIRKQFAMNMLNFSENEYETICDKFSMSQEFPDLISKRQIGYLLTNLQGIEMMSYKEITSSFITDFKKEYGERKEKDIEEKIQNSKSISKLIEESIRGDISPNKIDYISYIVSIPSFIFSKPETIALAGIFAILRLENSRKSINYIETHYKEAVIRSLKQCNKMKFK